MQEQVGRFDKWWWWWLCRSCRLYRLSARRRSLSGSFLLPEIHIRLLALAELRPCSFHNPLVEVDTFILTTWLTDMTGPADWLSAYEIIIPSWKNIISDTLLRLCPFRNVHTLAFRNGWIKSVPSISTPCWVGRVVYCCALLLLLGPDPWQCNTVTIGFLIMLYNATKRLPNRRWCIRSASSLSQSQPAFLWFSLHSTWCGVDTDQLQWWQRQINTSNQQGPPCLLLCKPKRIDLPVNNSLKKHGLVDHLKRLLSSGHITRNPWIKIEWQSVGFRFAEVKEDEDLFGHLIPW